MAGDPPSKGDVRPVAVDPAPGSVSAVFVCLADPSRREVIGVLARQGVGTATAIAEELAITRQAVTKHLTTLADAGLVTTERAGREVRYRLRGAPLRLAARWLEGAAGAWDDQLAGLKEAVEKAVGRQRDATRPTTERHLR